MHSNNKTDKRINASKIANTSTVGDNGTAALLASASFDRFAFS